VVSDKSVRHSCLANKSSLSLRGREWRMRGSRHTIYEIRYTGLRLPM
jgi:hypothetical protein